MDQYVRVGKSRQNDDSAAENEVRVTASGYMSHYIAYATSLLTERKMDTIILKALGQAINKTVAVAEIVKRRVLGLQQNTGISSVEIVDTWEPIEEGLNTIETPRQVSMVTITLSRNQLDPSSPGYQPPVGDDEIKDFQPPPEASRGGRRGRGRSRGRSTGRGNRNAGRGRSSAKNANTAAA